MQYKTQFTKGVGLVSHPQAFDYRWTFHICLLTTTFEYLRHLPILHLQCTLCLC